MLPSNLSRQILAMDLRNSINLSKLRNIAIASSKSVPDLNIAGESQAFHRFQEKMKRKEEEVEGAVAAGGELQMSSTCS